MELAKKTNSTETLWVVAPVYFDVESFQELRRRIVAEYPRCQFVIADDSAGRDVEIDELRHQEGLWIVEPPFNLGHQRAIVFALRKMAHQFAPQDVVITMDSDGEDRPEDIHRLLQGVHELPNGAHGVAVASRTERQESRMFKVFYFFFKLGFQFLTGTFIRSGNFAAFRGAFLNRYIAHPYFDLCYSSTLVSLNIELRRVPCPRGSRYAGVSKMNFTRLIMHGIRMLMPFIDRIAIRSLMFFALTFAASVVLALGMVGFKLVASAAIPAWATAALLVAIVLSFVALGNFLVLFAFFSQSQGLAMSHLEEQKKQDSRSLAA